MKIAIDGPSGAGKSTISKTIAKELNLVYIDTGAMYRAVGLKALRAGIDIVNEKEKVEALLSDTKIDITYSKDGQKFILDKEDVTEKIRTPQVSVAASNVAVIEAVRLKLVELQRQLSSQKDVIMDGRDIGTYVLPDAQIKIFLTATVEDRAQRRYLELMEKGVETSYADVLEDMKYRDKNDSSRSFAPLMPAEDALIVDTTGNTLLESTQIIVNIVKEKISKG